MRQFHTLAFEANVGEMGEMMAGFLTYISMNDQLPPYCYHTDHTSQKSPAPVDI